ncbi:hypothetical protein GWI33_015240 [Rhynchophorus ferrugineus]|uniref:endo-polygalacturonase n=1 Tax=Rhynchophorus ferrugineus TaxID=354439 RepID=A0A834I3P9_RHYFE|nr:hypothetical protein GWI33_015240 [Rhynchophorus ferrugineus]
MKFTFVFLVAVISFSLADDCRVTRFDEIENAVENCKAIVIENLFVPGGKTLELLLKEGSKLTFKGRTTFGFTEWDGPLVMINGTNVFIEGEDGAILDGQGQLYWDGQGGWSGTVKPTFFTIQLHNSVMRNIYVLNTPMGCALITDSTNVQFSDWVIDDLSGDQDKAPGKYGHNTDGFDIFNSTGITVRNASIYNQDDCVAVRSGSNIIIDNFYCHGGHGLSVSVGFSDDSVELNTLSNVTISNSVLEKGQNAIHVKTHVDSGNGSISNVTYENITFKGLTSTGINIQQNYRNLPPNSTQPKVPKNNIPIRNLQLINVTGSVLSSAVPIYIVCAEEGCYDWMFTDVSVTGKKSNDCNFTPSDFNC